MYIINQQKHVSGHGQMRKCLSSHENLDDTKKKLSEFICGGLFSASELVITKEIPFEFNCTVTIKSEEEET